MLTERHSHKKYLLPIIFLSVIVIALLVLTTTESLYLALTKVDLAITESNLALTQTQLETTQAYLAQTQADLATTRTQLKTSEAKLASSLQPPYTAISKREVKWVWLDIGRNLHEWTMPVDTYRAWTQMPEPNQLLTLTAKNQNYSIIDYRPLMVPDIWRNVIPDFAKQCPDGLTFAKEMFNLVTQLDIYSTEDAPHWPIETFTETGGDCKNLSILFVSLLKASSFPYKLQLIYMDSDHPNDPTTVNHVFIGVTLSGTTVYVDCTSKAGWGLWTTFRGWFFDIL